MRGQTHERRERRMTRSRVCFEKSPVCTFKTHVSGSSVECSFASCQPLHVMPRKEWKAIDPTDGWIKIFRGRRPPLAQWPRLQKQVDGSGGDGKSVKGRWRSVAPNAQLPNNVRTLETAIAALGPEDISVKTELEAAVARAKIQFQGTTRVSPSPDVAVAEAKKGLQVGKGARSVWRFYRGRSGFLEEGTRQGPRSCQRTSSRGPNQGVSGIHRSFGAASREVGGRSTGRVGTVDRREVKIVTTGKLAIGSDPRNSQNRE